MIIKTVQFRDVMKSTGFGQAYFKQYEKHSFKKHELLKVHGTHIDMKLLKTTTVSGLNYNSSCEVTEHLRTKPY